MFMPRHVGVDGQARAEHEIQGAEFVDVERQLADVERVTSGREVALEPGARRPTWRALQG